MKTLIIFLLFSSSVFADEWSTHDTYRETAFLSLLVIDYGQTLYIAKHPDKYHESSIDWAIGNHPTEQSVNNYFSIIAIAHPIISYYLPSSWRKVFQYVTISEKIPSVVNNYNIGIKIQF